VILFEQMYNTSTQDGFALGAIKQPEHNSVSQQFLNHATNKMLLQRSCGRFLFGLLYLQYWCKANRDINKVHQTVI